MGRGRRAMQKVSSKVERLARETPDDLPFTDPFNCQMCRERKALCGLHTDMPIPSSFGGSHVESSRPATPVPNYPDIHPAQTDRRAKERELAEKDNAPHKKECAVCGKQFSTFARNAKYCSDECRERALEARKNIESETKPKPPIPPKPKMVDIPVLKNPPAPEPPKEDDFEITGKVRIDFIDKRPPMLGIRYHYKGKDYTYWLDE